ncbi:MAG: M48 family metallopeptidase, partial [Thermoanaerobaculia bacterium]|nr:M48 family metallopeptidase [Thermoanaerobaculia bacterium]
MTSNDFNATVAAPQPSFAAPAPPASPAQVAAWPTEKPLFVLILLLSLGMWAVLAISIIGLAYVALIGLFLFFVHLAFVTHLRGSAVRLGPEQFPELHARVQELARAAGLTREPEAYLLESGGNLNAMATKFFRGRMIVLFSDLLDACGDDLAARDMVIGHEIGHLKAGHLDHLLLTGPGRLMPFLGSAYSRACERTCDRWGAALCGDPAGAVRGLAILAAGGTHAKRMNLAAYVAQRRDLDTGWMTLGSWLSAYPPLSERVELLAPALGASLPANTQGPQRAAGILALLIVLPTVAFVAVGAVWVMAMAKLGGGGQSDLAALRDAVNAAPAPRVVEPAAVNAARLQVAGDLEAIAAVLREHHAATGELPEYESELGVLWARYRSDLDFPSDPFTGES